MLGEDGGWVFVLIDDESDIVFVGLLGFCMGLKGFVGVVEVSIVGVDVV